MKIICVLLGTIIGAGFISGAEIGLFFNSVGIAGLFGILTSSIILGFVVYMVLKDNSKNYIELLENNINSKIIKIIVKGTINFFLIISYFIMIAGLSSFLNEEIGIKYMLSSILSVFVIFIIVNGDIKRIETFNEIFIPFLILLIFGLGFIIDENTFQDLRQNIKDIKINNNFFILGVTYASYNAITLIPVVFKLKERKNIDRKENLTISSVFSIITFICGVIIYLLVEENKEYINSEIPMLNIIRENNIFLVIFVKIAIIISIVSTAVSVQYAALSNIGHKKEKYLKHITIMNIIAIVISRFGFQNLIKIFYPLFGVIGILNFIILMKNYIKYSKISTKYCKKRQELI